MTEMTPELLAQMLPEPFLTAEAGDTVIIFLAGIWNAEQANSMVSYLMEWAPQVTWSVVQDPGFVGVIHVKAPRPTTAPEDPSWLQMDSGPHGG